MRAVVIDDGKGIPANDQERLFKRYGKLENNEDINKDGVGLGLLLCKHLVEKNKGKIEIHSDGEHCGSIVRFDMKMTPSIESKLSYFHLESDKDDDDSREEDFVQFLAFYDETGLMRGVPRQASIEVDRIDKDATDQNEESIPN